MKNRQKKIVISSSVIASYSRTRSCYVLPSNDLAQTVYLSRSVLGIGSARSPSHYTLSGTLQQDRQRPSTTTTASTTTMWFVLPFFQCLIPRESYDFQQSEEEEEEEEEEGKHLLVYDFMPP